MKKAACGRLGFSRVLWFWVSMYVLEEAKGQRLKEQRARRGKYEAIDSGKSWRLSLGVYSVRVTIHVDKPGIIQAWTFYSTSFLPTRHILISLT